MPKSKATTVEVNGYAGRHIRTLLGLEADEVATKMGVTRDYVYKIELGYSRRVGLVKFKAWQDALLVRDRRVLLCNPHTQAGNGDEPEVAA